MTNTATSQANSGRALALARRKALSGSGKAALGAKAAAATVSAPMKPAAPVKKPVVARAASANSGRAASLARRRAMSSSGKKGIVSKDRTRGDSQPITPQNTSETTPATAETQTEAACPCQTESLKAAPSLAQQTRAANPELNGRALARALREQKSRTGSRGQQKSRPTGRTRPTPNPDAGPARDAAWKVGAGKTSHGQTITGTMVGRKDIVTGDEASTCRDITGAEYMGADTYQAFCQTSPKQSFNRVGSSETGLGNSITGNQVGRSSRVTGDEPGSCITVTGSEYIGAGQAKAFCGNSSARQSLLQSSLKQHNSKRLTGDSVGRSSRVTGDETGADRELTGTQYERGSVDEVSAITGESDTFAGGTVTGTMMGRAQQITGDEPGTCKAVTGTPYASIDQYGDFCEAGELGEAADRMMKNPARAGAPMTGLQPSVGGIMTGDSRGACGTVSGTPYLGRDQLQHSFPEYAADNAEQEAMVADLAPGDFSIKSPARVAQQEAAAGLAVTGSSYQRGTISGSFGKGTDMVTGTEDAHFYRKPSLPVSNHKPDTINQRPVSRITGEGIDAGAKITGDDWDRGNHVTGTEGTSAVKRNQTKRGASSGSMAMTRTGRSTEKQLPPSPVTGGSGNTERGALVTYSGGARG